MTTTTSKKEEALRIVADIRNLVTHEVPMGLVADAQDKLDDLRDIIDGMNECKCEG